MLEILGYYEDGATTLCVGIKDFAQTILLKTLFSVNIAMESVADVAPSPLFRHIERSENANSSNHQQIKNKCIAKST